MGRAQPLHEPTGSAGADAFIRAEIDQLIRSSTIRIEQQRIHIKELCNDARGQAGAQEQLKSMLKRAEKLQDYRKQITP